MPYESLPVQIGAATNWSSVSAGVLHTMAIKSDGTLWGWGSDTYGQLGLGTRVDEPLPVQIDGATNWTHVSVGYFHTMALKSDGTLWGWGGNEYGQLGDGTKQERDSPTQISSAAKWSSVAASGYYTMAVRSDGTLWGWGESGAGRIGDGTNEFDPFPIRIGTATNWKSVSAGGSHIIALKNDGTLWGWGSNLNGQLGDGTQVSKTTPFQIGTSTNWASISAGSDHTIAIKNDGTLWGWGTNRSSEIGDGRVVTSATPIKSVLNTKVLISSGSLTFKPTVIGTSSLLQISVINLGTSSVEITGVDVENPYSATNSCSAVGPNSACVIYVEFRPESFGQFDGDLLIRSPELGNGRKVSLSGSGVIGGITATPTANPSATATPIGTATPKATATPTSTIAPRLTPIVIPPVRPNPTVNPFLTPNIEPDRPVKKNAKLRLAQLGRVVKGAARLKVDTYSLDEEGRSAAIKNGAFSIHCTLRRAKVTNTGKTNGKGILTLKMTGVKAGMVCRAQATLLGQLSKSETVKLK
jgi:alpha-tubulin suppressor-like RCC1 family protein